MKHLIAMILVLVSSFAAASDAVNDALIEQLTRPQAKPTTPGHYVFEGLDGTIFEIPYGTPFSEFNQTVVDFYNNALPKFTDADDRAFDKAADSMWNESCACIAYVTNGRIVEIRPPIGRFTRRIIVHGLKSGEITPITPSRSSY